MSISIITGTWMMAIVGLSFRYVSSVHEVEQLDLVLLGDFFDAAKPPVQSLEVVIGDGGSVREVTWPGHRDLHSITQQAIKIDHPTMPRITPITSIIGASPWLDTDTQTRTSSPSKPRAVASVV